MTPGIDRLELPINKTLQTTPGLAVIFLFGPAARGRVDAESDVDVAPL